MNYKQNSNWDGGGGLFKSQSRQIFTCGNYSWILIEQQQLTLAEKPSEEDLPAHLLTSGLFSAKVLTKSEPWFAYTTSALRHEALQRPKSSRPALQPAAPSKKGTPLPSLTWATKREKQKNRTSSTGSAFVCRRVHTLCLMPGVPLCSWDATRSLLQAQRRQESLIHLHHCLTCHNPTLTSQYTTAPILTTWDGIPSGFHPQQLLIKF